MFTPSSLLERSGAILDKMRELNIDSDRIYIAESFEHMVEDEYIDPHSFIIDIKQKDVSEELLNNIKKFGAYLRKEDSGLKIRFKYQLQNNVDGGGFSAKNSNHLLNTMIDITEINIDKLEPGQSWQALFDNHKTKAKNHVNKREVGEDFNPYPSGETVRGGSGSQVADAMQKEVRVKRKASSPPSSPESLSEDSSKKARTEIGEEKNNDRQDDVRSVGSFKSVEDQLRTDEHHAGQMEMTPEERIRVLEEQLVQARHKIIQEAYKNELYVKVIHEKADLNLARDICDTVNSFSSPSKTVQAKQSSALTQPAKGLSLGDDG